ncbi:MAG: phosphoribosylaminoimidazolesuccinocarboxamide synthase [Polyangiaceae bacterium]
MIFYADVPGLELLHRGKVRDSFRVSETSRLIVVTDRISAFDVKIETPIPRKGEVLNRLAAFWFEHTRDIIENHMLKVVDPQAMLVAEATPIRVEMVVRGYAAGSLWRGYEKGKRAFSGAELGEGITENGLLPHPIVTPTTKEESDREITPADIVREGLASAETYEKMRQASLSLFTRGQKMLGEKGILLADTKYEFGFIDEKLVLIDEMHTPDSSRFWDRETYERAPKDAPSIDKEYLRKWLLRAAKGGPIPTHLPPEVAEETHNRYVALYERVVGKLPPPETPRLDRLIENLRAAHVAPEPTP